MLRAAGCGLLFVPLLVASSSALAAERRPANSKPASEPIEMFEGMKSGKLDVKFIPQSSRQARVMIENKTDRPLSVKLPDAFAAKPVLAQLGGGGAGGRGGGSTQSMGGGMGGGGMGGGGMGGGMGGMGGCGGGFFNVPPEKVGKLKVECVCLEHGKDEHRAAIPYEITPLDEVSTEPRLKQVLKLLSSGKSSQRVAQIAAWHVANGMSWEELANKTIEPIGGAPEPYFSQEEMHSAMALVSTATHLAEKVGPIEKTESLGGNKAPLDKTDEIKY